MTRGDPAIMRGCSKERHRGRWYCGCCALAEPMSPGSCPLPDSQLDKLQPAPEKRADFAPRNELRRGGVMRRRFSGCVKLF